MTLQPGLCRTWSETQIVGFLMHVQAQRLNFNDDKQKDFQHSNSIHNTATEIVQGPRDTSKYIELYSNRDNFHDNYILNIE